MNAASPESPAAAQQQAHYDRTSVQLHWLSAGLVLLLWVLGKTIDDFAKGAPRIGARSTHIVLGAVLAVLLIARLAWRGRWGRRLPPANAGLAGQAARAGHVTLYLLLAATVALGIANAWIRGDNLFGLVTITSLAPGDKALRKLVENLHATFANVILIVAGLHALMALIHHYVLKDGVLRRMLPPRGS